MQIRAYDAGKDKDAVHRIWMECGWLDDNKKKLEAMDIFLDSTKAWVADIRNEPESLVLTTPGVIRYLNEDLPLCAVTGVTTSRIARKQGFAGRLTARAIASDAAEGALVAGLGVFDQGFYNTLGFGNGAYEHWLAFDPASLKVKIKPRVPHRLKLDDWDALHKSRLARSRGHAACNLFPPETTRCEMIWSEKGFGLGYYDGPEGELTHHLWGNAGDENGPYSVWWMSYQTSEQFLELMALLKNLGDQVYLMRMGEPPGIQIQDLLDKPFRHRRTSNKSKYENRMSASAYWQLRICDLAGCLAQTHLRSATVRFNLKLSDPIEQYLEADAPWRGIAGDYIVTLGETSEAARGTDANLPTLTASVGAFTRMWMGILPATGLSVTDDLSGSPDLLETLDWTLRLPKPKLDWDF